MPPKLRSSRKVLSSPNPSVPRKAAPPSAGPVRRSDGPVSRPHFPASTGGLHSQNRRDVVGSSSRIFNSLRRARVDKGKGRAIESPSPSSSSRSNSEIGDARTRHDPRHDPRIPSTTPPRAFPQGPSPPRTSPQGPSPPHAAPPAMAPPTAPANTYILNFGRNKGRTLHQIEPEYLLWLISMRHAKNFSTPNYLPMRVALEDFVRRYPLTVPGPQEGGSSALSSSRFTLPTPSPQAERRESMPALAPPATSFSSASPSPTPTPGPWSSVGRRAAISRPLPSETRSLPISRPTLAPRRAVSASPFLPPRFPHDEHRNPRNATPTPPGQQPSRVVNSNDRTPSATWPRSRPPPPLVSSPALRPGSHNLINGVGPSHLPEARRPGGAVPIALALGIQPRQGPTSNAAHPNPLPPSEDHVVQEGIVSKRRRVTPSRDSSGSNENSRSHDVVPMANHTADAIVRANRQNLQEAMGDLRNYSRDYANHMTSSADRRMQTVLTATLGSQQQSDRNTKAIQDHIDAQHQKTIHNFRVLASHIDSMGRYIHNNRNGNAENSNNNNNNNNNNLCEGELRRTRVQLAASRRVLDRERLRHAQQVAVQRQAHEEQLERDRAHNQHLLDVATRARNAERDGTAQQHEADVGRLQQQINLQRQQAAATEVDATVQHHQQVAEEQAQHQQLLDVATRARDAERVGIAQQHEADVGRLQQQINLQRQQAAAAEVDATVQHHQRVAEEQAQNQRLLDAATLARNAERDSRAEHHRVDVDRLQQQINLERQRTAAEAVSADLQHRLEIEDNSAQNQQLLDTATQTRDAEREGMAQQRRADVDRLQQQLLVEDQQSATVQTAAADHDLRQVVQFGVTRDLEIRDEQEENSALMDAAILSMSTQRDSLTQQRDADMRRLNSQMHSERAASSSAAVERTVELGIHQAEIVQALTDCDNQLQQARTAAQSEVAAAVNDRDNAQLQLTTQSSAAQLQINTTQALLESTIQERDDVVDDRDAANALIEASFTVAASTGGENARHRAERDTARANAITLGANLRDSSVALEEARQQNRESEDVLEREQAKAANLEVERIVEIGRADDRETALQNALQVEGAARARERSGVGRAVDLLGRWVGRGQGAGNADQEQDEQQDGRGDGMDREVGRVVEQVEEVLREVLMGPMAGGFPVEDA